MLWRGVVERQGLRGIVLTAGDLLFKDAAVVLRKLTSSPITPPQLHASPYNSLLSQPLKNTYFNSQFTWFSGVEKDYLDCFVVISVGILFRRSIISQE